MTGGFWVEGRGVLAEEDDCGRSVSERTEAEDLDCGRDEVSGASSKVSCLAGKRSIVESRRRSLAPSLSELSALSSLESVSAMPNVLFLRRPRCNVKAGDRS